MVKFLEALTSIAKVIAFLFIYILVNPFLAVWKFALRNFLFRLYITIYSPLKKRFKKVYLPAKSKILYPFSTRYVIHFIIIIITILVTTHSIRARETTGYDVGQRSILFSLIKQEQEEIVETRDSSPQPATDYFSSMASVTSLTKPQGELEGDTYAATTKAGSALLKPSIASTTQGDRPREKVEYYIVQPGDTVSTIAENFNLTSSTILWENKLSATDYIKPGDKLTVLPSSGVSHQVKSGDTLDKIASKYKVTSDDILEYNKLASADAIKADQILIIPGGKMPPPPTLTYSTSPSGTLALVKDFFIPPSATVTPGTKFQWPTSSRRINQYFGWRHTGVDIDGSRSPIYAAESGIVEFVGWDSGYGLSIIVNHGGGMKTRYAHESNTYVKPGQSVGRGETIGLTGCTGWCTGDHVHFEVIISGRKVNPLSYL